uniref:Subtilisin-like protease fibronectin type-III domain-containing protein n=1 Tax=Oryza meridionalis TaxID=40149 RepID=A0A0E0DA87_9ORYZ
MGERWPNGQWTRVVGMAFRASLKPDSLWRSRLPSTYTLRHIVFAQSAFDLVECHRGSSPFAIFTLWFSPRGLRPDDPDVLGLNLCWLHGFGRPASNERYGFPTLADGLPQKTADPFDYSSGFIDPNRAVDPGLADDVDPEDYTTFLDCYSAGNSSCESESRNLNLPSIAIPNLTAPTTVLRTVTYVGQADAVYKAVVQSPPGVQISVEPTVLKFSQGKNTQSFKITFTMTHKLHGGYLFGSLAWSDGGAHYVRIPIAVRPVENANNSTDRSVSVSPQKAL